MDSAFDRLCCRFCLVEAEPADPQLISPCRCAGTQAFIHLKCLRKWQENVQARDVKDERAFRCSVCRSLFSVPPPKPRASTRLFQALRGVGGAICITLLALGLSGPPVPHLALLVLLLLGTRSSSLLALALLLMGTLLATLHTRGLRVVMRMDGAGRLGLAVIRHGGPVEGLGPGTLLVASEGLDHTMFRRSVVLLYEHGREGAKGVLLTQGLAVPPAGLAPMPEAALGAAAAAAAAAAPARGLRRAAGRPSGGNGTAAGPSTAGPAGQGSGATPAGPGSKTGVGVAPFTIRHFLGGPVGMPGEGVHQEMVLLHTITGVQGAISLPLQAAPAHPVPANRPGIGGRSRSAVQHAQQETAGSSRTRSSSSVGGEPEEPNVAGAVEPGMRLALAPNRAAPAARTGSSHSRGSREVATSAAAAAGGRERDSRTSEGIEREAAVGFESAAVVAAAAWQPQLFMGGALTEVLERAGASSDTSQELANSNGGSARRLVHVYHGVCSWAEGQLEGEIHSGAWSIGPGRLQDVLPQEGAQPQPPQLWAALLASGRIVRPRD